MLQTTRICGKQKNNSTRGDSYMSLRDGCLMDCAQQSQTSNRGHLASKTDQIKQEHFLIGTQSQFKSFFFFTFIFLSHTQKTQYHSFSCTLETLAFLSSGPGDVDPCSRSRKQHRRSAHPHALYINSSKCESCLRLTVRF